MNTRTPRHQPYPQRIDWQASDFRNTPPGAPTGHLLIIQQQYGDRITWQTVRRSS